MKNDVDLMHRAARASGMEGEVVGCESLGGGCIADVRRIIFGDGASVVLKVQPDAARAEEEARGLKALQSTETIPVPAVLGTDHELLILEHLPVHSPGLNDWERFGANLAALHHCDVGSEYGFDHDNHLGDTLQSNTLHEDWVEFNRSCRIGWLRNKLAARSLADAHELRQIDRVLDGLDTLLPRQPRPSLIHGDLWSGNALPAKGRAIAVIDPAVSIGDGLADIAMMELFGGFPEACHAAYREAAPDLLEIGNVPERLAVYRLYHLLNHWLLFGRSYAGQALSVMNKLLG